MPTQSSAPDLLRRFTPTPFEAHLNVMGRVMHLETNSLAVLEQARRFLGDTNGSRRRDFILRIVAEGGTDDLTWPEMTAFSQDGLSFASIGQHGFLAVDAKQREAVAFVAEELVKETLGFGRPFLAMLFTLSLPPMGLCPIWAACVTEGEAGLLIFGLPRIGKTVSAYLAGSFDLHFHADRLVFLEVTSAGLLAWGEPWPACFYQDAHAVLPELNAVARPFDSGGQTYLCLEKPRQANAPLCVRPAACVFLERQDMHGHRLTRLREDDFRQRLGEYRQFSDSRSPQLDRSDAWSLLCRLPAFHLAHGSDPKVPARLFRDLIEGHES